ncbi:hypothetical protein ACM66B_006051 [Microbotryomycetes sp. NB124-2]
MAANDSVTLCFTRGLATIGLGLAAGYCGGVSISTMPTLFKVDTISPRDRLHYWSVLFDTGAKHMIPAFVSSAVLSITSSILAQSPAAWVPATWIARHRRAVWAFCAASSLGVQAFTVLAILPVVKRLKNAETQIRKDAASGNGQEETDYLIQKWTSLHHVRTIIAVSAFGLAVSELVLV